MQKLRLIPVEIPEDSLRREWIVEGIGGGKPNGATLWWDFDVPEPTVQGDISMRLPPFDEGDAALLATLLPAMEQGKDLLIEGSVSPRLLDRLTEFQAAFCSWAPDRFAAIGFEATEARISSVPIAPDGAISSFSGGVDSGFTAWRHATNRCGHANQRIVAGLMVHGFDIPLEETAGFDVASRSARDMLETLALPLITVRTNLREVLRMDWLQLFGTALAATLHLMKRSARIGLIASNATPTHSLAKRRDRRRVHADPRAGKGERNRGPLDGSPRRAARFSVYRNCAGRPKTPTRLSSDAATAQRTTPPAAVRRSPSSEWIGIVSPSIFGADPASSRKRSTVSATSTAAA